MIFGVPPFAAESDLDTYANIVSGNITFPSDSNINPDLKDIIKCLCHPDQSKRMGRIKGGIGLITDHLWFSGFGWGALYYKKIKAPFLPEIESEDGDQADLSVSINGEYYLGKT